MEAVGAVLGILGFFTTLVVGVAFLARIAKLVSWRWANWRFLSISVVMFGLGLIFILLSNLQDRRNTLLTIQNNVHKLKNLSREAMPKPSGGLPQDPSSLKRYREVHGFAGGVPIEFNSTLDIDPQIGFLGARLRLVHQITDAVAEYAPTQGSEIKMAKQAFYRNLSACITNEFSSSRIAVKTSPSVLFHILHGESVDWSRLGDLWNSNIVEYVQRITPLVQ